VSSSPTSTSVVDVNMPQMGVSVAEGTVVEWKKRVGDWVEADETIVEISTDKVETEVPAPATGRVAEILVETGTTVDVGALLARIDTGAKPGEAHADEHAVEEVAKPQPAGNGHAPPVSPVVRRIADEHGIDVAQIAGTGRRGRVTKKDILAFIEQRGTEDRPLHIESPYKEEAPVSPRDEIHEEGSVAEDAAEVPTAEQPATGEPLSVMRQQIGEHMLRSLKTAAHCTTVVEADMSRIEAARGRLSYLPFVARAAIAALREYPMLNATLEGDRLTVHDEVNLGIAVSLGEQGLIVPVVHNAHELSHEGLAARIKDLAERARTKRLKPEEVQGGTFTITNPGAFGALLATPIINQPQVAILDLEAVVKRPVVVDGDSIAIRPMTYLCMSWDHRALDGALAAQFLSAVRRHIEEWSG
jgi:pyruvate/2-oxoglutarate dehydrogenase complex dihydrolipoamide acyltransferase (E2) component